MAALRLAPTQNLFAPFASVVLCCVFLYRNKHIYIVILLSFEVRGGLGGVCEPSVGRRTLPSLSSLSPPPLSGLCWVSDVIHLFPEYKRCHCCALVLAVLACPYRSRLDIEVVAGLVQAAYLAGSHGHPIN